MIKDLRYIIKKIIIGIGIILGISFIRSCKVYALDSNTYTSLFYNQMNYQNSGTPQCYSAGTKFNYVINGHEYNIEYKNDGNNVIGLYINDMQVASENFSNCNPWLLGKWPGDADSVVFYYISYTQSRLNTILAPSVLNYPDNFPVSIDYLFVGVTSYAPKRIRYNFSNGNYTSHNSATLCHTSNCNVTINGYSYANQFLGGYNLLVYGTNQSFQIFQSPNVKYITSNYNSPNYILRTSSINSLNPIPIIQDNILLGFNFDINFSNFDSNFFKYYYRFENSSNNLINNNNLSLSYNQNGTLFVWVEDLEGNVIDSESFTISDIGDISDSNNIYDILFSSHGKGISDNQMYGVYTNVDINVVYKPNTDYLIYQYQYVNENDSLDNNNWVTHDSNVLDLNVDTNGTLYTRILDKNNNILYSATFTNSIIGDEIVYNVDNDEINSFYSGIKSTINYNKPISNLILLPITLLSSILNGMNATCVDYNLGNLMGTNLKLPCVDVRHYLGNQLYLTIDLIISGVLIFRIVCFIIRCYNGLIFMKKNPVDDFTGDGE